jgi:REP element-mobilizing transposase RayT
MRSWLLTNTTYGTWLPGDPRGSVASVRDLRPTDPPSSFRLEHDLPGEPFEEPLPGLEFASARRLAGPPIDLERQHAELLLVQFQETAGYRRWTLRAVAVMANHFHLVVQVSDDPPPQKVLADFKAYGTRCLNQHFGQPVSETWWTTNGSKRKLPDDRALASGIHYVLYKQPHPLVVWSPELGRLV